MVPSRCSSRDLVRGFGGQQYTAIYDRGEKDQFGLSLVILHISQAQALDKVVP